jgi:serine/threonine protein kinase
MALEAGSRVGSYEIVAPLATGGMSEVYRARDLKLGREVALKLLPEHWGDDPDRVARFEREAQLLAALNHPNIAVIHGRERVDSRAFLILELISGETLAERLARGPLDLDEALRIFLQVAQALEAAHGKGIIHRDLKPANVQITSEGVVKLLDFGLGKDLGPLAAPIEKTKTFDGRGTRDGLVMGTPAYMSPEQARGRDLGKATDIWSFGVTFFEALSGKNPFLRDTISDTLSAILNDEPPWHVLPSLPRGLETLLRRAIRKEERRRLHDIADARIEIEDALAGDLRTIDTGRRISAGVWLAAFLALALALATGGFFALSRRSSRETDARVRRFTIDLPATAPLSLENGEALAVSPDSSRLVYAARLGERRQLFLRPLAALEAVPIAGTEGGESPFFSPGGDWIGFFADGKLKKLSTLSLAGGSPTSLADASSPRGCLWIDGGGAGTIVFSISTAPFLQSLPETGGAVTPVSKVEDPAVRDHRWPAPLPGGRSALLTLWGEHGFDLGVVDLQTGRTERVVENGFYPRYASTGHLVFLRDGDLYAVGFDPRRKRVLSEPAVVIEDVAADTRTGAAFYEIGPDGTLFYLSAEGVGAGKGSARAVALLVDRRGEGRPIFAPRTALQVPRFSPDGRLLLMTVGDGETSDLWVFDRDRGAESRLTLQGNNGSGVFAPDGRRIAFASDRDGIFSISATGARPEAFFRRGMKKRAPSSLLTADSSLIPPTSRERRKSTFAGFRDPKAAGRSRRTRERSRYGPGTERRSTFGAATLS